MSPSGAEFIRQIKAGISEIDPAAVHKLVGNGVAIIDVRESDEWAQGRLPGAKHVPRGFLESRIEGIVPDRSQRVILYCASGNRSALAAHTLSADLGYEHVESMTGGITLWKDRGYEVEVPRTFTPEQRERYSRHLLIPEIGEAGQQKLLDAKVLLLGAGGLGSPTALYLAAAGVGTLGIVDGDVVDLSNLQRQVIHNTTRVGVPKVESAEETIHALNPDVKVIRSRRASTPRTSSRSSRAMTSLSTASTTSRRATCSTTRACACRSRSSRPRSSASRATSRSSSPTKARATAASSRSRRRPSSRHPAARTACSACCLV